MHGQCLTPRKDALGGHGFPGDAGQERRERSSPCRPCPSQARSSTRHLRRSSPSRRRPTSAGGWARGWPPRASSTWPGRAAWTCAMLAGWLTAACATPSPRPGPTAGATSWACGPSTCTPTRRATRTPRPATTPSATQVGLGGGVVPRKGGPRGGELGMGVGFCPFKGPQGTRTPCLSNPCFH